MKFKILILSILTFFMCGINTINAQNSTNNDDKIEKLLAKKREYNKRYGFGYRIQLYNGLENKAKSYKSRFEVEFPGVYTKLEYDAPEWKVQIGNYKTRLEADKSLNRIREKFTGAIVIAIDK